MSIKVEYTCDGCGEIISYKIGYIELLPDGTSISYHCCKNVMCMNKIQQKQCSDFVVYEKISDK